MTRKPLHDPLEEIIAQALDHVGEPYLTAENGQNPSGLDFRLPDRGVEIEVKAFHTPRIEEQMSRAPNVIAVQGRQAVELLASWIKGEWA